MTDPKDKNKGTVFFIDPYDTSLPNEPRKVYALSYESFCAKARLEALPLPQALPAKK